MWKRLILCAFTASIVTTAGPSSASAVNDNTRASCLEELGKKKANELRDQCMHVSGATHPPCGTRNTCDSIIEFISDSCRFNYEYNESEKKKDTPEVLAQIEAVRKAAAFCKKYVPSW